MQSDQEASRRAPPPRRRPEALDSLCDPALTPAPSASQRPHPGSLATSVTTTPVVGGRERQRVDGPPPPKIAMSDLSRGDDAARAPYFLTQRQPTSVSRHHQPQPLRAVATPAPPEDLSLVEGHNATRGDEPSYLVDVCDETLVRGDGAPGDNQHSLAEPWAPAPLPNDLWRREPSQLSATSYAAHGRPPLQPRRQQTSRTPEREGSAASCGRTRPAHSAVHLRTWTITPDDSTIDDGACDGVGTLFLAASEADTENSGPASASHPPPQPHPRVVTHEMATSPIPQDRLRGAPSGRSSVAFASYRGTPQIQETLHAETYAVTYTKPATPAREPSLSKSDAESSQHPSRNDGAASRASSRNQVPSASHHADGTGDDESFYSDEGSGENGHNSGDERQSSLGNPHRNSRSPDAGTSPDVPARAPSTEGNDKASRSEDNAANSRPPSAHSVASRKPATTTDRSENRSASAVSRGQHRSTAVSQRDSPAPASRIEQQQQPLSSHQSAMDATEDNEEQEEARPNPSPPQPQPSLRELVAEERRRAAEELSLIRREEARRDARPNMKAVSAPERQQHSSAEADDEAAAAARVLEARRRAMADLERVRRQDRQTERSSAVKLPWGHPAAASAPSARRAATAERKHHHDDPSVTPVAKSLFERADTDDDGFLRRREAYAIVREHLETSPPPTTSARQQPVGIAKIQNAYDKVAKETREELGERAAEVPPGAIDVSGLQKLLDAVASQSGGGPRRRPPPAESTAKKPPSVSPPPRPPQEPAETGKQPVSHVSVQQQPMGDETRDALKALSMSIARANSIQTLPAPHPQHSPSPTKSSSAPFESSGRPSQSQQRQPQQQQQQQQQQLGFPGASAKALSPPRPPTTTVPERRSDPVLSQSTAAALAAMRNVRSRNTSAASSPGPRSRAEMWGASAIGVDSAGSPVARSQLDHRDVGYFRPPQPVGGMNASHQQPAASRSAPHSSSRRPLSPPPSVVPLEGRRTFAAMGESHHSEDHWAAQSYRRNGPMSSGASSPLRGVSRSPTRRRGPSPVGFGHVGGACDALASSMRTAPARSSPPRRSQEAVEAAAAPQPKFVLAPERARVLLQTLLKTDKGFVGKLAVPIIAQALCELGLFPSVTVASQFMRARRLLPPDTACLDTALVDYVAVVSELKRAR